ncbi:Ig-like domain-containing protein [Solimonas sp. K1W22B-7]|uniref:Ig-like domain-containing protein n=1 Tax=Solimonas sp. K1W22B-7 TaxID=2303331 RepID=UPI0013C496EE|nr:Ig-like domain-containing protein [Solimonas sp. K1W22B-7]
MKGFRWMLLMSALAVAACDGARSPDFAPERSFDGLEVRLANGTTPVTTTRELPAGTNEDFRAFVDVLTTVPPGYELQPGETVETTSDGKAAVRRTEEVTSVAAWTSNSVNIATVDANGRVTGVAQGTTTISAAFEGESDSFNVQVTAATLAGGQVLCVRPATTGDLGTTPCAITSFSRPSGVTVEFEAIGRFSDGQNRRIASPYVLNWTSTNLPVAAKPATGNNLPLISPNFETATIGSTSIEGRVVSGSTPLPVPDRRSATLNVVAANAFCDTEFPTTAEIVSQTCIGCSVNNPNLIVDGDLDTFADLNIPLGLLLLSNISVTVANPVGTPAVAAGAPVGFLLSRSSNDILSAQLLGSLEVTTVRRTLTGFEEINDAGTSSELLRLTLLGIRLPAAPQFLLSTGPTTVPYDGVKLTFSGGLLSLLTSLNVNTACARANPNPPAP